MENATYRCPNNRFAVLQLISHHINQFRILLIAGDNFYLKTILKAPFLRRTLTLKIKKFGIEFIKEI
jgi:hypothetical protein